MAQKEQTAKIKNQICPYFKQAYANSKLPDGEILVFCKIITKSRFLTKFNVTKLRFRSTLRSIQSLVELIYIYFSQMSTSNLYSLIKVKFNSVSIWILIFEYLKTHILFFQSRAHCSKMKMNCKKLSRFQFNFPWLLGTSPISKQETKKFCNWTLKIIPFIPLGKQMDIKHFFKYQKLHFL